jgi:hypothetical protein
MCRNQQQTSLPLIGPCGLPRHELGINPFMVGAIYAENSRICKSDIEDCSKCPLNPDIKTLNHCEI